MTTAALFTFYNAFDEVTVSLDNDSPHPTGPYTVRVEFGDNSPIKDENSAERFDTLAAAMERFTALIKNEVVAVLDDGTFK